MGLTKHSRTSSQKSSRSLQRLPHALHLIFPSPPCPPARPPQGLDAAVLLSNNVEMADALRLQSALELSRSGSGLAVGRIMVVKAYLGKTATDKTTIDEKYLGTK